MGALIGVGKPAAAFGQSLRSSAGAKLVAVFQPTIAPGNCGFSLDLKF